MPRIGAGRVLAGSCLAAAGGLIWLSRLGEHSSYAGGLLGLMLITGTALGMVFVPLCLIVLSGAGAGAGDRDSGAASSLLNAGEQVGGAVGLAVLGSAAWTVVANTVRAGHRAHQGHAQITAIYHATLAVVVAITSTFLTAPKPKSP